MCKSFISTNGKAAPQAAFFVAIVFVLFQILPAAGKAGMYNLFAGSILIALVIKSVRDSLLSI